MKKSLTIRYTTIASLIILIAPMLRYYNVIFVSINLGVLLSIALFMILILIVLKKHNVDTVISSNSLRLFYFFVLYSILITMINSILGLNSEGANSFILFIISCISMCFMLKCKFDIQTTFKIYNFFVWFIIFVYLLQWFLALINVSISFKLPLHTFSAEWDYLNYFNFGMRDVPYVPPTSIFSERAHLSEYLIPYVCFALYSDRFVHEKRIAKAVTVSAVIVSTVSGNGVVLVAIVWLCFFCFFSEYKPSIRLIIGISGIMLLAITFVMLKNLPQFSGMFNTLFVNKTGTSTWTKADYRIYRGLDIFSQEGLFYKIFGIGFRNLVSFVNKYGITTKYGSGEITNYLSAIFQCLIYYGIVGSTLFFGHIYSMQKNESSLTKGLVIVFLASMVASEVFIEYYHSLYLLLIIISIADNHNEICQKDSNAII